MAPLYLTNITILVWQFNVGSICYLKCYYTGFISAWKCCDGRELLHVFRGEIPKKANVLLLRREPLLGLLRYITGKFVYFCDSESFSNTLHCSRTMPSRLRFDNKRQVVAASLPAFSTPLVYLAIIIPRRTCASLTILTNVTSWLFLN